MGESWGIKLESVMEELSDGEWHVLDDLCGHFTENGDLLETIVEKAENVGAIEIRSNDGGPLEVRGTKLVNKILELPEE